MKNSKGNYFLDITEKKYFVSCLLMEIFINHRKNFPLVLFDDDKLLEEYLIHMVSKGWLDINDTEYLPTQSGRELLKNHKAKMIEFRSLYKIYSAVDTGEGEFGYSSYFDFDTDEEFEEYINQDHFEDLRIALCEFKNLNPLEIVFLEMVDERRFNLESTGWQFELVSGLIWDELVEIVNTNISLEELAEEGDEEEGIESYTGEEVMRIIVEEGNLVLKQLLDEEESISEEQDNEEDTDEIGEPYYEVEHYSVYYDGEPEYYSPIWGVHYY